MRTFARPADLTGGQELVDTSDGQIGAFVQFAPKEQKRWLRLLRDPLVSVAASAVAVAVEAVAARVAVAAAAAERSRRSGCP